MLAGSVLGGMMKWCVNSQGEVAEVRDCLDLYGMVLLSSKKEQPLMCLPRTNTVCCALKLYLCYSKCSKLFNTFYCVENIKIQ